jgi:type I restriction enzyme S subunit
MNADRLLALYERVADAPDAIARLRRFVLDLAVRGKLVAQDPAEEPASALLKRIATEKARLVKVGEIRKPKPLPPVTEAPFDLPPTWRWARIREITSDRGQEVPIDTFTYIDVTAIDKDAGTVADPKVLDAAEAPSRARKLARKGDVIYSCVRPYLLNVAVIEQDFDPSPIVSTAFAVIDGHGLLVPRFIWVVLRSPFMIGCVEENQRGQAYPAINDADFALLPFPLPPLAEQRRIVAKVDELMALLDRLEAARNQREAARDRLTAASLARLTTPDEHETARAHARFALDTLPALTTRTDQIRTLRQTILNLAVRGKLVEQDPTDKPASELLKRIADEKSQLLKAKQFLNQRPPSLDPDYAISTRPSGWKTIALGDMLDFVTSGSRGWSEYYAETGPFFIRAQNIRFGQLLLDNLAHVQPPTNSEGSRTQVAKGDVLIVITGAGVTNPAILERDIGEAYVSQHVGLARPTDPETSRWLLLCLLADCGGRLELVARAYGAGRPGLNLDNIRSLTIPLPPLAEQHRIVAKVDALMALCDRLETALADADATRQRLLEALLHEALAPATPTLEAAE